MLLIELALDAGVYFLLCVLADYIRSRRAESKRQTQQYYDPNLAASVARRRTDAEFPMVFGLTLKEQAERAKQYNDRYAEIYNEELRRREAHKEKFGEVWK